jgi:hypothetical protein
MLPFVIPVLDLVNVRVFTVDPAWQITMFNVRSRRQKDQRRAEAPGHPLAV